MPWHAACPGVRIEIPRHQTADVMLTAHSGTRIVRVGGAGDHVTFLETVVDRAKKSRRALARPASPEAAGLVVAGARNSCTVQFGTPEFRHPISRRGR